MAESDDATRARMVTEVGVYLKYGLADKAVEHGEKIEARWPGAAADVWETIDRAIAPTLTATQRLWLGPLATHFAAAVLDVGRRLGRTPPDDIELVDVGGVRFVEVRIGPQRFAFAPSGATLRRADGLAGFAAVVAAAAPLDGPDDVDHIVGDLVDVFERVTGLRVERSGVVDTEGNVVVEPPHCLGGLVRFAFVEGVERSGAPRRRPVVVDIRVPRVVD